MSASSVNDLIARALSQMQQQKRLQDLEAQYNTNLEDPSYTKSKIKVQTGFVKHLSPKHKRRLERQAKRKAKDGV